MAQFLVSTAKSTALSKVFNSGGKAMDWSWCVVLFHDSSYRDNQTDGLGLGDKKQTNKQWKHA